MKTPDLVSMLFALVAAAMIVCLAHVARPPATGVATPLPQVPAGAWVCRPASEAPGGPREVVVSIDDDLPPPVDFYGGGWALAPDDGVWIEPDAPAEAAR